MRMKPASKGLAFFLALSLIFSSFVPLSVFAETPANLLVTKVEVSGISGTVDSGTSISEVEEKIQVTANATEDAITAVEITVDAIAIGGETETVTGSGWQPIAITLSAVSGAGFTTTPGALTVSAVNISGPSIALVDENATDAAVITGQVNVTKAAVVDPEPEEPTVVSPSVIWNLDHVTATPKPGEIISGEAFSTTLTADEGYENVTVTAATMGGKKDGVTVTTSGAAVIVSIAAVTSNVAITATADKKTYTEVPTTEAINVLFPGDELADAIASMTGKTTNQALGTSGAATVTGITTLTLTFTSSSSINLQGIEYLADLEKLNLEQPIVTTSAVDIGVKYPSGLPAPIPGTIVPKGLSLSGENLIGDVHDVDKITKDNITYRTEKTKSEGEVTSLELNSLDVTVTVTGLVNHYNDILNSIDPQLGADRTINVTKGATTSSDAITLISKTLTSGALKANLQFVKVKGDATATETGLTIVSVTGTTTSGFDVTVSVDTDKATNGSVYLYNGAVSDGNYVGEVTVVINTASTGGNEGNGGGSGGGGGGSSSSKYTVSFNSMGGSSVASQSVAKNGTVTKPADPTKDGFIFDGWYLDKEYKEKYDFSTAVTKSFTLYAKWTENDAFAQFTDVSGHWAVNAIEFVVDKGLFFGTSKNSFSPDVAMTRGMFVTVLGRLNGVSPSGNAAFSDVSSSMYYSPYIAWATSNNIVSGVGNNKFEPDREISRQEMATMMYNYAKFIGKEGYEEIVLADVYADAANIAVWAEVGMEYTASNKLMVGKPGELADPLATATRAEVAQLIMQFSNFLADAAAK